MEHLISLEVTIEVETSKGGVRRLEVPGGRVESAVNTLGESVTEVIAGHFWHTPVFVPQSRPGVTFVRDEGESTADFARRVKALVSGWKG